MSGSAAMHTDGWLPLALPADGETFRTSLVDVAESLTAAGATMVESDDADATVDAKPRAGARGEWLVAAMLEGLTPHDGTRLQQVGRRVQSAAAAAGFVRRTYDVLERERWARLESLLWDFEAVAPLHRTGWGVLEARRLPRGAAIVARRDALAPTIWERGAAEAAAAGGNNGPLNNPTITGSGVAMNMNRDVVFRCAVGTAGEHILDGARMLERLHRTDTPRGLSRIVPAAMGKGSSGIGRWTLERRIGGKKPASLSPRLLDSLVDLIAEMFVGLATGAHHDVAGYARVIERTWGSRAAPLTRRAAQLDAVLTHVPRGFAHGDLWRDNLLVSNDELLGIVDWVRAGDGRFPLGDLLHLRTAEQDLTGRPYGETVVSELLPWARAGGDTVARSLCRRFGFEPTADVLEALVLAYWYDRTATELASYRGHARNAHWMESNVGVVADAVA